MYKLFIIINLIINHSYMLYKGKVVHIIKLAYSFLLWTITLKLFHVFVLLVHCSLSTTDIIFFHLAVHKATIQSIVSLFSLCSFLP